MSGPKEADVRLKLDRALDMIGRQLDLSADYVACLESQGEPELEAARCEASAIGQRVQQPLTDEARQIVPWEAGPLAILRANVEQRMQRATAADELATSLRAQARELNAQADRLLSQARKTCERIERTLSVNVHYLYQEDRQAAQAREDAKQAQQNRAEAIRLLQRAADAARQARHEYAAVREMGRHVDAIHERIDRLVGEVRSGERAREQQEQQAVSHRRESQTLLQTLGQLDHQRFAPGSYDRLRRDIGRFESAFQAGRYEHANQYASQFLDGLRRLVADVQSKQADWTSLRSAAARDLEAVQQEADQLDREALRRWSGDEETVAKVFARLDEAGRQFEAGQFQDASETTDDALQHFRRLHAAAQENRSRHEQRSIIAEAVMQALCDLGYDTPCFQYAQRSSSGADDELSPLAIYASHPGGRGDMDLRIGLDGHVDLEVKGIPEGREAVCHEQVLGLQQQLGAEVDFQVTNWGRAVTLAESDGQSPVSQRAPTQTRVAELQKERRDDPSL